MLNSDVIYLTFSHILTAVLLHIHQEEKRTDHCLCGPSNAVTVRLASTSGLMAMVCHGVSRNVVLPLFGSLVACLVSAHARI